MGCDEKYVSMVGTKIGYSNHVQEVLDMPEIYFTQKKKFEKIDDIQGKNWVYIGEGWSLNGKIEKFF